MDRAINTRITRRELVSARRCWYVLKYRLDATAKQAIRGRCNDSRYWAVMASTWVDAPSLQRDWFQWSKTLSPQFRHTSLAAHVYRSRLQRHIGSGAKWLVCQQRLEPVVLQVSDAVDAAILDWAVTVRKVTS